MAPCRDVVRGIFPVAGSSKKAAFRMKRGFSAVHH
jgi:hypothetical protein